MFIKSLSGVITDSDFKSYGRDMMSDERFFNFVEEESGETSSAVFGSDTDGGDMTDAVGFDDGDAEGAHFVVD